MDAERYKHIAQKPLSVQSSDIPDLQRIIRLFPYFEEPRLLYLLALARQEDIRFPEELRHHIPFISERAHLKKLVQQLRLKEEDEMGVDTVPEALVQLPEPEPKAENPIAEVLSTIPTDSFTQEAPHPVEAVEEKVVTEENQGGATEQTDTETDSNQKSPSEPDEKDDYLEKLIISSAVNHSIQREVSTISADQIAEEDTTSQEQPAEIDMPELEEGAPQSLGSWLRARKTSPSLAKKEPQTLDVIDAFIARKQERITPKKDFFSPSDLSKKSNVDAEELITETLLDIYLKQGDYEKVLRGYRKLTLKFPEKKSYFAGRIEAVNKIKNEKKK